MQLKLSLDSSYFFIKLIVHKILYLTIISVSLYVKYLAKDLQKCGELKYNKYMSSVFWATVCFLLHIRYKPKGCLVFKIHQLSMVAATIAVELIVSAALILKHIAPDIAKRHWNNWSRLNRSTAIDTFCFLRRHTILLAILETVARARQIILQQIYRLIVCTLFANSSMRNLSICAFCGSQPHFL